MGLHCSRETTMTCYRVAFQLQEDLFGGPREASFLDNFQVRIYAY